ncbi:hypothetical protein GCM10010365_50840 [Streptomyces poonensis]|uniref:DUF1152 domain-containing protein n=2 Tax=Streptomyces poonensis TaxID=68255 RepID=A0A918PWM7_9ACTN|nr:hypothetical protein GCM10010365_50840 [Streptomyces poonensis]GLJ89970.1 hypothetical protein GCM10017589_25710 [Streptomyces poonensis]
MLHTALHRDASPAVILTYAWDRLLIDPAVGPRAADDFTGLQQITPAVRTVPAGARPVPPGGSTLPRLAAELPHTFALLDPHHGVEGVTRQVEELVTRLAPVSVDVLDVGGDILARGDEPALRSPLADAVTLAACCQVNAPVRLLVAGPGLDGELSLDELREVLGPVVHTFTPQDVEPVAPVLEWHPSEAAGMLAATARGVRGTCEVRDAGLPVPLTDDGPKVCEVGLDEALSRNRLARAIMTTATLDEVEAHSRAICGRSEIDHEREKAARTGRRPGARQPAAELDPEAVGAALDRYEAGAGARGVSHTTFRHLTEALGVDDRRRHELRDLLIDSRPEQYDAPLWRVAPAA